MLWVPKIWSYALTRHDALACWEPMCRILYGCSPRWQAWRCVRDALRTLRSSCCATNSQSCGGRTTGQPSLTRTGPFERPDRTANRASDARNRYKIRYTRTQHRPASRQVNAHGRVFGTHRVSRRCLTLSVVGRPFSAIPATDVDMPPPDPHSPGNGIHTLPHRGTEIPTLFTSNTRISPRIPTPENYSGVVLLCKLAPRCRTRKTTNPARCSVRGFEEPTPRKEG